MAKPTVYLETTLIGHLVGRIHPDTVIAARQMVTREWWDYSAPSFRLVASQLVMFEWTHLAVLSMASGFLVRFGNYLLLKSNFV